MGISFIALIIGGIIGLAVLGGLIALIIWAAKQAKSGKESIDDGKAKMEEMERDLKD